MGSRSAVMLDQSLSPQAPYARLRAAARPDSNADFLSQILASWMVGQGAMPRFLGLDKASFEALLAYHFPSLDRMDCEVRLEVEPERAPELDDVRSLLLEHRSGLSDSEVWMAQIIATGCMGSDHLWSDLGLFSRPFLGQMLLHNFRPLAAQNDKNMRWKKFFYRQLCAKEGFILCRSPSCETCSEYKVCFAEEGMFE
ncbi:nitrogen fixation protein NifQ [Cohaesibacter intestini]|uniref:nitrogen fixation protein NifQ n=1 Tax=Cohaesibacter intestini TaxID=2211145 RepID=UPI000DEADFC1|nr:nitrogen fixation protein NifQ [Cohaesibacter intestini]